MPVKRETLTATAPKRITAWSYSRLRDWKACPQMAKFKFIDKLKEPGNQAMQRGGDIHKMAENYVIAPKAPRTMPDELACFAEEFKDLRKRKAQCESEWAFTNTWLPTGWFDDDCWCRVKMDAHYLDAPQNYLVVIDHKTGKVDETGLKYQDQEELYALGGMLQYPDVEGVWVQFWYLDAGVIGSSQGSEGAWYPKSMKDQLIKKWNKETKPMLVDVRFNPKPGNACRYCHFSKSKNGPCKY